jgi:hypothetical protein
MKGKEAKMNAWFWYAVGAAVLYGAHQMLPHKHFRTSHRAESPSCESLG